ncbi:unnamed protein product [Closterium sp. NIES-54]
MEALPADEDAPQTSPDEPPLPAKPTAQALPEKASDDPRSGLDFLRATGAPVTPEPPRSTVHDSAARVTPTPPDSPHPVAFTLPPAVASCSKDPPPPSPSPTPSTVCVSVGPLSASSTPKRARNGKWAQSTPVVGGCRIPPPDIDKEAEQPEEVDIPVRADTGSPALTKMQLREQVYLEASINYETKWSQHFSWLVFGKTKYGFPYVKCSTCMSYAKGNTRYAMQGDDGGPDAASCGAGHARHSSTILRRVSHTVFNLTVRLQLDICDVHKEGGGKQFRVRGVDGEGRPINHLYTMHERKLKGHKQGSTYADCVKLCRQFARDCVDNLNERLDDLGKLGPTKLFRAGKWPEIKAQREKKCKEWLHGCSRLFRNKLPGFDLKAAERELHTFCAIMESHHEMESFAQHNFLRSVDSKRRWPNLLLLWQTLAVLPLSTVECERGFSRQNIIKSWVRGALCNARLGELMQISLMKYEIEWPEALEVWRSMRRRRPVKSLKLAVAERERKGKQKEGEVVAAGTAGENEDEGEEEEEEDDEVEQDLGDNQEVVEEEDNSFLSDDEDVEEVYFIDKPVH